MARRSGLRLRLFVASIVALAVSVGAASAFLSDALEDFVVERTRASLSAQVRVVARAAESEPAPLSDAAAWDAFCDAYGALVGARVTVVGLDGRVAGDSSVDSAALGRLENHAERPEVKVLLGAGTASVAIDTRRSTTTGLPMAYAATTLVRGASRVGVLRLALPLSELEQVRAVVSRSVLVAGLIALVLAVLLSSGGALLVGREARALADAASRMAAGDLDVRTGRTGGDELGELGAALDRLAKGLSDTLRDLRHESDLVGGILAGMQEGVLLVDRDGRIVRMNPALREMLLLSADAVGAPAADAFAGTTLPELLARASSSDTPESAEVELTGLKPRRLLVRAQKRSADPEGVLAVCVDVTELRRLESLRRDFVANVSHELRTPVTAVRSAAETLRAAVRDDPASAAIFIDIIDRNAERLHRLVEDLLELSRIESRQYDFDLEAIPPGDAVKQALDLFAERAAKKRIRLAVESASGVPPLFADRRALETVLSNLLENALKYCPEDASIRIVAVADPGGVRVDVVDDGPGIPAKHLPRLFERFYRVDKGRAREVGGTGLGLSIVKHLVEAMGGTVHVDSVPGKGSAFGFVLPAAPAIG